MDQTDCRDLGDDWNCVGGSMSFAVRIAFRDMRLMGSIAFPCLGEAEKQKEKQY
jgi:hypothetical protein